MNSKKTFIIFYQQKNYLLLQNTKTLELMYNNEEKKPSSSNSLLVFFLGLAALGIDVYLVIDFISDVSTAKSLLGGNIIDWFKLFPAYLRFSGAWGWMIAALVLGVVTDFIDGALTDNDDKLSNAGTAMANIAIGLSILFIVLAIFAKSITKQLFFK